MLIGYSTGVKKRLTRLCGLGGHIQGLGVDNPVGELCAATHNRLIPPMPAQAGFRWRLQKYIRLTYFLTRCLY
jgi:hypothetical protein